MRSRKVTRNEGDSIYHVHPLKKEEALKLIQEILKHLESPKEIDFKYSITHGISVYVLDSDSGIETEWRLRPEDFAVILQVIQDIKGIRGNIKIGEGSEVLEQALLPYFKNPS